MHIKAYILINNQVINISNQKNVTFTVVSWKGKSSNFICLQVVKLSTKNSCLLCLAAQ